MNAGVISEKKGPLIGTSNYPGYPKKAKKAVKKENGIKNREY